MICRYKNYWNLCKTILDCRRPIMIDDKRLQVGFNEDEIRRFLPRDVRQLELRQAQLMAGL